MWLEFTFGVPKMTFPFYTTGLICEQLKVATAWKQSKHYLSQISPMAEEQGSAEPYRWLFHVWMYLACLKWAVWGTSAAEGEITIATA